MQFKCKLYVQGDSFSFYRGDREDRSQRQARWEMRHNVQQVVFFFFFPFSHICFAQKQVVIKCLSIAFMTVTLHLFPYSTKHVDKPEQESGNSVSKSIADRWTARRAQRDCWSYIFKYFPKLSGVPVRKKAEQRSIPCSRKPPEERVWLRDGRSQSHVLLV